MPRRKKSENTVDTQTPGNQTQVNQGGLLSTDGDVAGVGASFNQHDANEMDNVGGSSIGNEGADNPADIDIDTGNNFSEKNPVPDRQSSRDRGSNARDK